MKQLNRKDKAEFPLFVGKVNTAKSGNLLGTSGGPIIGLVKDAGHYEAVAMQVAWIQSSGITYGFPVPTLVKIVEEEIRRTR